MIALLIKAGSYDDDEIKKYYLNPLVKLGINQSKINIIQLDYYNKKKVNAQDINTFVEDNIALFEGINTLYFADANYFKVLCKVTNTKNSLGYAIPVKHELLLHCTGVFGYNYRQFLYNPNLLENFDMSLKTLESIYTNKYMPLGQKFNIENCLYYKKDIDVLFELLDQPTLTCDIETTGLDPYKDDILCIGFAYSDKEGKVFKYKNSIKSSFKYFFIQYKGTLVFHNASFDIKFLIKHLFMEEWNDYKGLLEGLHILTKNFEDTKILCYLALNSTVPIALDLKSNAYEYLGDYAIDVKDTSQQDIKTLMEYNLYDCFATYYVLNKMKPKVIKDEQLTIYETLLLPTVKVLIQLELTGIPINLVRVQEIEQELQSSLVKALKYIKRNEYVHKALNIIHIDALEIINSKLKKKVHPIEKVQDIFFNINSSTHLRVLLFNILKLPIHSKTKTGLPSTDQDALEAFTINASEEIKELLNFIIEGKLISKILTTFIPAFYKKSITHAPNKTYLYGNFHIGNVVSGRLSSSSPNLTAIPSGSRYGKLIKSCFAPYKDELFVGADFDALEDKVNTLLTKDPNKEKIYTDGYDSHSFRTYHYFKDKLPDIEDTVESINSIAVKYPELRAQSKTVTFALTYQGSWHTLHKDCGFTKKEAKEIENNYHQLYKVSDNWVRQRIHTGCVKGYVTLAFGLRLRTPLLAQSILNNSSTLIKASEDARTVGNALSGQSYCMLNNRAIVAFMESVWKSPYRYKIKPSILIHDAIYLTIANDIDILTWVNERLIECMSWQDLPELKSTKIQMSAELALYYPSWGDEIKIPNQIDKSEIVKYICRKHNEKN